MVEIALVVAIGSVAYLAGYYHGLLEGRHRERYKLPIHWLRG